MNKTLSVILLVGFDAAMADNLELGLGTGKTASYKTKKESVIGEKNNYSLGYEHPLNKSLHGVVTLGQSDFARLKDRSLRLAPRFYYGNLFASAGVGFHNVDGNDSYTGLLGIGFRTNSEATGKVGYGIDLTQEQGFGDRKLNQLDLSMVLSIGL